MLTTDGVSTLEVPDQYVPISLAFGVGCDEAGLVGQDNGLYTVAEPEFGQDVGDVGFDGGLAEEEFPADFGVGFSGGDRGKDVDPPGGGRPCSCEVAVRRCAGGGR